MNRSAVIATVVATTGVLVAGSIASVAVINAASSSEPITPTIALVADDTGLPVESSAPMTPAPSTPATTDLPALPEVPDTSGAGAADDSSTTAAPEDTPPREDDSSGPAPQASTSTVVYTVGASEAARAVVATTGGTVLSVSKATRGGYRAWAVKVRMPDGSVVTGYVDRASGVVYDWVTNQAAPAPSYAGDDDSDDDSAEESDDEDESEGEDDSEHGNEQEHEDDDEHEGDDD